MDKIGPIYLDKEEAEVLLQALNRIIEEQEHIRKESTKKIASCFSLCNMIQKNESKND